MAKTITRVTDEPETYRTVSHQSGKRTSAPTPSQTTTTDAAISPALEWATTSPTLCNVRLLQGRSRQDSPCVPERRPAADSGDASPEPVISPWCQSAPCCALRTT